MTGNVERDDQYDLEPDEDFGESASASGDEPPPRIGIPRPQSVEPLSLEDDEPAASRGSAVKDLDVCPNCGASMRGSDQLVCIRCGFDLKTMRQVRTITGETTVTVRDPDLDDETARLEPIIKQDQLGYWLPIALGSIAAIVLLICYLAGLPALYPELLAQAAAENRAAVISFTARMEAVLQMIVLTAMLAACGMGAMAFLAYLNGMRVARTMEVLKVGLVRIVAIVLCMRLAALIALPPPALEWSVEAVLQLAIFAGLSLALFRLKPRDALTLTGSLIMLFLLLWLGASAIVWATS